MKRWERRAFDPAAAESIESLLGAPAWLAQALAARGVKGVDEARAFLEPELGHCHSPWLLCGMDAAVARLLDAHRKGETVLVWGDYDVDGVTSTALLLKAFQVMGLRAEYHIPDRLRDGYGLNTAALSAIHARGIRLVVTVDCGVSAAAEADAARALGLDLIITDHHLPGPRLPGALALINPQCCPAYPYAMLGGVGVAFKLAQALWEKAGGWDEALRDALLELVALGTVADVAPLTGENRVLVREGIRRLRDTRWPGLRALAEAAGADIARTDSQSIGYVLGPRLNAGGRIGDPRMGVELLLSRHKAEAQPMAKALDEENRRRREIEKAMLAQARPMAEERIAAGARALVLWSPEWHPGVVGLAASRLLEAYHRPAFVLSVQDGQAKGSARARGPFKLMAALESAGGLLTRFGGHAVAAGMGLEERNLGAFREAIEAQALAQLGEDDLLPRLSVDAELPLLKVDGQLMTWLARLSPFGMGNPKPVFTCSGLRLLAGARAVGGGGEHLKGVLAQGVRRMPCIGFGLGPELGGLASAPSLKAAYQPSWNEFMGKKELQLELKDLGVQQ